MRQRQALLPPSIGPAVAALVSAQIPGDLGIAVTAALWAGAVLLASASLAQAQHRVNLTLLASAVLSGSAWSTIRSSPSHLAVFGFLTAALVLFASPPNERVPTNPVSAFPGLTLVSGVLLLQSAPLSATTVTFLVIAWFAQAGVHFLRIFGDERAGPRRALALIAGATAVFGAVVFAETDSSRLLLLALTDLLLSFGAIAARRQLAPTYWGTLVEDPARLLVSTFAAVCVAGLVFLRLPTAVQEGKPLELLDAAFTAVSAVCVTGLSVVDTGSTFSFSGQLGLLVMIQVGGLGIMTFYTAGLAAIGQRLTLRQERAMASALGLKERGSLLSPIRRILAVTLATEGLGAALLSGLFLKEGLEWKHAVWRALFTAVSAFNNAGFALQADSLMQYQTDALTLHVVSALIVLGGLAPATVLAVPALLRGNPAPPQIRMVLITTAGLLGFGAVSFALTEWHFSLGELGTWDKLQNAWFQSVTLRTAGFNSVDLGLTQTATQTMMLLMMFVGGSPGGTAGGMKTTSLAIVLLKVAATLRGREQVVFRKRLIARGTVDKAVAVAFTGLVVALTATMALQLTQKLDPEVAVFEVVSALATVGLTLGGTAQLDGVGKAIIMACMFAGRVGPLTLFLFLMARASAHDRLTYAEAKVDVG